MSRFLKKPSVARWIGSALVALTLVITPVLAPSRASASEVAPTPDVSATEPSLDTTPSEAPSEPAPELTPADSGATPVATDSVAPAEPDSSSATDPTSPASPVETSTVDSTAGAQEASVAPTEPTVPNSSSTSAEGATVADPTSEPAPTVVPTPVLHVSGGNCVAGQNVPVNITWTWDAPGKSFFLGYNFHYVDANGVWRQVFGGEATPSIATGTYTVPASALDLPVGRYAIIGSLVEGSVIGDAASAEFTVAQCDTEPTATEFTPVQPTFEVLPCLAGTPQTRVNLPAVDSTKEGFYTVGGEQAFGTIVVPGAGVIRLGFQFVDGVVPSKGWSLSGFVPNAEACPVVIPPVDPPVDPPVVTPPVVVAPPVAEAPPVVESGQPVVTDDGGHKTPSKVETDGDTSLLVWPAALLSALALISGGAALRLVTRRR